MHSVDCNHGWSGSKSRSHIATQRRPEYGTFLGFVCREMQRRFQNALDSLFIAPAALPMREVISASIEPSADMIEPRYVNERTNSTSSPSMFIIVVIAEEGEIIMAFVFVQLIDIPTLAASLLNMRYTNRMSSEEGEKSAMSSALSMLVRRQLSRSMPSDGPAAAFSWHIR